MAIPTCEIIPTNVEIYRGTTPTITVHLRNIDFDMSDIAIAQVTLEDDRGRNQKVFDNPTIDQENKNISIELSQADTLSYDYGMLNLQIRIKLNSGRVAPTKIYSIKMGRTLNEEIL